MGLLAIPFGGIAAACLSYAFLSVKPLPESFAGPRGQVRERISLSPFGRSTFLLLRLLGAYVRPWSSKLPLQAIDRHLIAAGNWGGLESEEFLALHLLGLLLLVPVSALAYALTQSLAILLLLAFVFVLGPLVQLRSDSRDRQRSISRDLPGAIDLAALCMGAGLDFLGSLNHVVACIGKTPLRAELELLLQEIRLGTTRRNALLNFSERNLSKTVDEFAFAVIQAEERGTPLAEVLTLQASVLRARRSVRAEEAAARAGVLLMAPMFMMVVSIVLIVMGPLFIDLSKGGMF